MNEQQELTGSPEGRALACTRQRRRYRMAVGGLPIPRCHRYLHCGQCVCRVQPCRTMSSYRVAEGTLRGRVEMAGRLSADRSALARASTHAGAAEGDSRNDAADSGQLDGACSVGEELLVDAWQLHSVLVVADVQRLVAGVTAWGARSGQGFLARSRELLAARGIPPR